MRYWDSSALVALFVDQEAGPRIKKVYADDPEVVSWTLSEVEFHSAIARLARSGSLAASSAEAAASKFDYLWTSVKSISLIDSVKARARRILRLHSLKAADALQLAGAHVAAYDEPTLVEFVCLDDRLREAAAREGFRLLP